MYVTYKFDAPPLPLDVAVAGVAALSLALSLGNACDSETFIVSSAIADQAVPNLRSASGPTRELTAKKDALPTELSRGMKQKLAIACGLLHRPSALLLDEPLTGLDPVGIRRMKETIAARAREGAAVILSSHLLHLVEELCTRLLVIRKGQAVALGTIAEIVASRPELAGRSLEEMFIALTGDDAVS